MDIVTPILRIISLLYSCSTGNNRCCYLLDLQENKDALKTAMDELKNARDDVKRRVDEAENNPNEPMKCNQEVNGWLQRMQAIEGEVLEVIQKADQEIKGRCFGGYCPKNCWTAHKIGKLVIRKLATVNYLRRKGSFVDVAYKLPPSFVKKEPVDLTVGMESMLDRVWRLLVEDEVRIMGLYGNGGVGKTTLLKQINNEFLKSTTTSTSTSTHSFDVVILVVVSKEVNVHKIHKEIGDRLGLSSPNEGNICNALSKKNFLLLLDDIWEKVDLQSIGIPPPSENTKFKVVFTTRYESVCGLMKANKVLKVQCLPRNEAWSLFQENVGERALNSFPRARELAKVVAKKCGGLPLALITIGQAMSSKKNVQEWNHAITTLQKCASDFPGMGKEVFSLLKLSYDNLRDDTIKSCFLYCALFPEDVSIDIAKLIDYWIGEGFILLNDQSDHIDEARNHGHDIIGILKSACLLESGRNEKTEVKMHDTIRDLALWIAHECGSKRDKICIIETFDLTAAKRSSWYKNTERIYLRPSSSHNGETKVRPPPLKSPNLTTLIYHFTHWIYRYGGLSVPLLPHNFFEFTPLLRVLDLSHTNMETFPISITELLELRYLSLSKTYIQVLPVELGKLVKLQHLDLSYMMHLKKIPSGVIGSLVELRVLNLFDCSGAEYLVDIEELYVLKHLNDFGITINTRNSSDLTKLLNSSSNKNLQMCTRHLVLCKHNTTFSFDQPSESEDIKHQSPSSSSSSSPIITLEKVLQMLFNLETLSLQHFTEAELMNMGIEQQQHLGSSCFRSLIEIEITNCKALKDLTWVGYVPNLKKLYVYSCKALEEIVLVVDDFGGSTTGRGYEIISSSKKNNNVQDIFKSLINLRLWNLPKLKSICRKALAFPCLESMEVCNCPQLKKLPFDSGSNFNNTLQIIVGGRKWWSELQWEKEDHNNNNKHQLLKSKFLPYFVKLSFYENRS